MNFFNCLCIELCITVIANNNVWQFLVFKKIALQNMASICQRIFFPHFVHFGFCLCTCADISLKTKPV